MKANVTIRDAIRQLEGEIRDREREIAERKRAKFALDALIAQAPRAESAPPPPVGEPDWMTHHMPDARRHVSPRVANAGVQSRTGRSVAAAAIELLREAGRPLHGLSEIFPELQRKGYALAPHGLATTLLRTGVVVRVSRGTFALREAASTTAASLST